MRGSSTRGIGDQSGRVAVVTGANSGLGLHTAIALAAHGAEVILACRQPDRAATATARVAATATGPAPWPLALDLADLASVATAAAELVDRTAGIDVLVNNAGVMATPRMLTADGYEMQLGTNHLGHFALTLRLWPALIARPDARVVTVSSFLAHRARLDLDDLQGERAYHPWTAYGQAKLANLLFSVELDRRARARGDAVRSVAVHPGYSSTALVGNGPRDGATVTDRAFFAVADAVIAQSAAAGARPALLAATAADVEGGEYYGPRGPLHLRGRPTRVRVPHAARREMDARRLWEISEELTATAW